LLWLIHEAGPAFSDGGNTADEDDNEHGGGGAKARNGRDNSRSAAAFRKGTEMRRAGKSFAEFKQALLSDPVTADWARTKGQANNDRELTRIWEKAGAAAAQSAAAGVSLDDFYAYMPRHNYIYTPSRETWPASSVNVRIAPIRLRGRVFISPTLWLDRNKPVEQMTWAPGLPMIIRDRLISDGGFIERGNVSCFNLYLPPAIVHGDPTKAGPWIEHGRRIFPNEFDHIELWFAHRIQRPQEKINHAVVLGGPQGIGKDTLLEPVKRAVGPWNFVEISPQQML